MPNPTKYGQGMTWKGKDKWVNNICDFPKNVFSPILMVQMALLGREEM